MLLPDNIKPENCIYYNGAFVIQVLQKTGRMRLLDLFSKVSDLAPMSFPMFILCLDWLYLIDVAKTDDEEVVLCS